MPRVDLVENKPRLRQVADPGLCILSPMSSGMSKPGGTAANIRGGNRPAAGKNGQVALWQRLVCRLYPNWPPSSAGYDKAALFKGGQTAAPSGPTLEEGRRNTKVIFPVENVTDGDMDRFWPGTAVFREETTELFLQGTEPWQYCGYHFRTELFERFPAYGTGSDAPTGQIVEKRLSPAPKPRPHCLGPLGEPGKAGNKPPAEDRVRGQSLKVTPRRQGSWRLLKASSGWRSCQSQRTSPGRRGK